MSYMLLNVTTKKLSIIDYKVNLKLNITNKTYCEHIVAFLFLHRLLIEVENVG